MKSLYNCPLMKDFSDFCTLKRVLWWIILNLHLVQTPWAILIFKFVFDLMPWNIWKCCITNFTWDYFFLTPSMIGFINGKMFILTNRQVVLMRLKNCIISRGIVQRPSFNIMACLIGVSSWWSRGVFHKDVRTSSSYVWFLRTNATCDARGNAVQCKAMPT